MSTLQSGQARFRELPGGRTEVEYTETVKADLAVPTMMAPMLRPVINQMLAHEIKGFLNRMVGAVPVA